MNRIFIKILFIALLCSCSNDIDRNISTNLQVEAKEIFRTSLSLDESLFFAFSSFEDYHENQQNLLPGCPEIILNNLEKKITLNFNLIDDCQNQKIKRQGQLILYFIDNNTQGKTVTLEYNNYKVENFEIKGSRTFIKSQNLNTPNRWSESFSDLIILDEFNSTTKVTGRFTYDLQKINNKNSSLKRLGKLDGRNITGRRIKMTTTSRQYTFDCLSTDSVIPEDGNEIWEIFRTSTRSLSHILSVIKGNTCSSKVNIELSDGRIVVFEK